MKRLVILLACVWISLVSSSAQSILGNWSYSQNNITAIFKFGGASKGELVFEVVQELASGMSVKLVTTTHFTYVIEGGKSLMWKVDYDNVKTDYEFILSSKAKQLMVQKGYTEKDMKEDPTMVKVVQDFNAKMKTALPLMVPAVSAYQIVYMKNGRINMVGRYGKNPINLHKV